MTEEQVFLAALDLADAVARIEYLDRACGRDAELRRRVEDLLAAHFKSGDFLDQPFALSAITSPASPGASLVTPSAALHDNTVEHPFLGRDAGDQEPDETPDDLHFLRPPTRADSRGRIGHYEVLQVLGKGGFGIVLRAFDDMLQRVVALKVLAPSMAATSPARKRFEREARASAKVRHENVVHVYAVENLPLPYLAMEFIPGETLQQRLDRTGPLEVVEILRIARQIAEGLSAAHETGLIHRDIKPANILIEKGTQDRVKITDFGLARAADDASTTQSGVVAGTPMYMAPEQAKGEKLDHRADLFSLGSVMYVMASGRPPFRAATTFAVLKRVVEEEPRPIQDIIPEVPQWLCDIIARLQAKKPEDRFQTARAVADHLADCEAKVKAQQDVARIPPAALAQAAGSPSTPSPSTPSHSPRRGRWLAATAIVLLPWIVLAATEWSGVTQLSQHLFQKNAPPVDTRAVAKDTTKDPAQAKNVDAAELDRWVKAVAALPAGEQVVEVRKELLKRNLEYTGRIEPKIEDGVVTEVLLMGDVADLNPVRAFVGLKFLSCDQLDGGRVLKDISPLKDMNLTSLTLHYTPITELSPIKHMKLTTLDLSDNFEFRDLSPIQDHPTLTSLNVSGCGLRDLSLLRGLKLTQLKMGRAGDVNLSPLKAMKLTSFHCYECDLVDLSPLKGMPLTELVCCRTRVSDLSPLQGAPLVFLNCSGTAVKDLSPLKGAPLEDIRFTPRNITKGFEVLRGMTSLKVIGVHDTQSWPAAEFWARYDKGEFTSAHPFSDAEAQRVAALPAAEQVAAVRTELLKRNPDFTGNVEHKIEDGVVTELIVVTDNVTDLSPIRVFGGLRALDCRRTQPIEQSKPFPDLAPLKEMNLAHLTSLNLQLTKVTDADLALFKDCKKLQSLVLNGTRVTDAGLAHFKDCTDLQVLVLYHTQITSQGLAFFQRCTNLRVLHVGFTDVGNAGLALLKDCVALEEVELRFSRVTDAGLAHFKNCENLTYLNLTATNVGDAGLEHLERCQKLKVIALDLTGVTDAGMARLKELKSLEHLIVPNQPITNAGLAHLKECKKLTFLNVDGTKISDAGLRHLAECKNLTFLKALKTQVTAGGIDMLKRALPECKIEWDGGVVEP